MKRVFVVLSALGFLAGCGEGQDVAWQDKPGLSSAKAGLSASMSCYIDTPAYDEFSPGYCFAIGTTPSVAVFQLSTPTPAAYVVWYDHPECSGDECAVSIRPGQSITMGAYYVTYQGTPTQGAGATAEYSY